MAPPDTRPRDFAPQAVRAHLENVLASPPFARSQRLRRFLAFIVDRKLTHREDDIQEYVIALEVFDRKESFDPRSESIVRVEARRLRDRLAEYYAHDGRGSPFRIVLPERGYVPTFEVARTPRRWTRWALAAGIATATAALLYGLTGVSREPVRHEPPPLARESFEKGMVAWQQWTNDGAREAVSLFRRATTYDPEYARAHAWLSMAYRQQVIMGDTSFDEVAAQSLDAARTAIGLDPKLADGYHALAVLLTFEPDWHAAEQAFRTALRIEPDNADVRHALGIVLLAASPDRLGEAEAELRRAAALQPGVLAHQVVLAKILYFQERYLEAQALLEEALRIDAYYPDAMRNLAAVLVQAGDSAQAVPLYREAQALSPLPWGDGLLGHALAVSGDRASARGVLDRLEATYGGRSVGALAIATVQVGLEDWKSACDWLDRAWDNRELRTRYVSVDPIYAPIRDRPCVRSLVERMALSELAPASR